MEDKLVIQIDDKDIKVEKTKWSQPGRCYFLQEGIYIIDEDLLNTFIEIIDSGNEDVIDIFKMIAKKRINR